MIGTGDTSYVRYVVVSEHLGLGFVQPQIPHPIEVVQLLNGLGHLRLRVGQDEHVIRKGQQVTSVDHLPQFRRGTQCFLQVNIEEHG